MHNLVLMHIVIRWAHPLLVFSECDVLWADSTVSRLKTNLQTLISKSLMRLSFIWHPKYDNQQLSQQNYTGLNKLSWIPEKQWNGWWNFPYFIYFSPALSDSKDVNTCMLMLKGVIILWLLTDNCYTQPIEKKLLL